VHKVDRPLRSHRKGLPDIRRLHELMCALWISSRLRYHVASAYHVRGALFPYGYHLASAYHVAYGYHLGPYGRSVRACRLCAPYAPGRSYPYGCLSTWSFISICLSTSSIVMSACTSNLQPAYTRAHTQTCEFACVKYRMRVREKFHKSAKVTECAHAARPHSIDKSLHIACTPYDIDKSLP